MEQRPSWEADRFSASQEIHILWNPKVHYRIHKCPPTVFIRSQLDPVHTPTPTSWRSILIVILPSTPGTPKWSLSLRFPHQNPAPHMLLAPLISFFSIWSPEKYLVRSTDHKTPNYVFFLHYPLSSSLFGPNILLSTLFGNTLSLRFSLTLSDEVSNPYKTTSKTVVRYIIIFVFLDSKLEDKRFCTHW